MKYLLIIITLSLASCASYQKGSFGQAWMNGMNAAANSPSPQSTHCTSDMQGGYDCR